MSFFIPAKRFLKYVQLKHIVGLLLSIIISVSIILFSPDIHHFKQLGYLGVFLISFLSNATLFLTAPGLVFVFLLGGTLPDPLLVGIAAGLGGTLGELTGYLAGYGASGIVTHSTVYSRTKKQIDTYGMWSIFLLALIPNPAFDVAGMIAGSVAIPWWKFLLSAGCGKVIKAIITAYLGYYSFSR